MEGCSLRRASLPFPCLVFHSDCRHSSTSTSHSFNAEGQGWMTHSRNLSDWCSQVMANFSEDEVWIGNSAILKDPQEAEFEAPQFDF